MIHVRLPETVQLVCPLCREHFSLRAQLLDDRSELHCPACGRNSAIYTMLEGRLRRRLYQAVRDEMENQIHQAQRLKSEQKAPGTSDD